MTIDRGVAVVTGGTAGLGRAVVRELAAHGWDIAVIARGADGLEGAVADVQAFGRRALGISADVADRLAIEDAADRIENELGPIELWVNDAMVGVFGDFLTTEPADFERATQVNYFGFVNGTRAALSRMVPRERGHVIQIGSALAHRGIPLQAAYCGAKHAVKGFTESVRVELRASGSAVTIGLVTLPGVNTTQFNWNLNRMPDHPQPVAPILEPEVVARSIVSAAQHPRRNTWVGIATAYTVLGNRVAPWFMDRYLARTGIDGQQTDEDAPRWGSNLFEPQDADVDRGARGPFSDKSGTFDPVSLVSRRAAAVKSRLGL